MIDVHDDETKRIDIEMRLNGNFLFFFIKIIDFIC